MAIGAERDVGAPDARLIINLGEPQVDDVCMRTVSPECTMVLRVWMTFIPGLPISAPKSFVVRKRGFGYTDNRTTSARCKMSETLKILALRKKLRGNNVVRNNFGIRSLETYPLPSTEIVKRGVLLRRYRAAVQVVVANGALIAVESRRMRKPAQPAPAVELAESHPDLDKFKAAFGLLKGLKVFGDAVVQFEREMRDDWQ